MAQLSENELLEIAKKVFTAGGIELTFEQEGNMYYACFPSTNGKGNIRYSSPAPTKTLAAFAAEQRYLTEEETKNPELRHYMPGDTYLEKAQNRVKELQNRGIVPASEHPKFKSDM